MGAGAGLAPARALGVAFSSTASRAGPRRHLRAMVSKSRGTWGLSSLGETASSPITCSRVSITAAALNGGRIGQACTPTVTTPGAAGQPPVGGTPSVASCALRNATEGVPYSRPGACPNEPPPSRDLETLMRRLSPLALIVLSLPAPASASEKEARHPRPRHQGLGRRGGPGQGPAVQAH